jgi:hypothetical protein
MDGKEVIGPIRAMLLVAIRASRSISGAHRVLAELLAIGSAAGHAATQRQGA